MFFVLAVLDTIGALQPFVVGRFLRGGVFRNYGLVGTVLWWRAHLTGRWFSQGLVAGACSYFLSSGRPFLYALGLLGTLLMAGVWAWTGFGFLRPRSRNFGDVIVAALCVLFLLSAVFVLTPAPSEVWFWSPGRVSILFRWCCYWSLRCGCARDTATSAHFASIALAALVIGGCSETSIVLAFIALACGAARMTGERRRLAVVGLAFLLCSAAFALSAPGNFMRLHAQTAQASLRPPDVVKAIHSVVRSGFVLKWHSWLLLFAIATTLSPEIGALFPRFPRRFGRVFWFGIPVACAVSLLPAIIAFHGPFPLRTLAPVTFAPSSGAAQRECNWGSVRWMPTVCPPSRFRPGEFFAHWPLRVCGRLDLETGPGCAPCGAHLRPQLCPHTRHWTRL